jgi:hypothetical protein
MPARIDSYLSGQSRADGLSGLLGLAGISDFGFGDAGAKTALSASPALVNGPLNALIIQAS